MMRPGSDNVMAWRCMRAAMVVVMLMVCLGGGGGVAMVESARPISAAIEQRITSWASATLATTSEGADGGWSSSSSTSTPAGSNEEPGVDEFSGGGTGGVDTVWDAESESPPAQRQRDRSLWGMSKRLVPTGPNPLHN